MLSSLAERFDAARPAVDFCSLRFVRSRTEEVTVRSGVLQPPALDDDIGAMVTVVDRGGLGYAATSDLSPSGLSEAFRRASEWAHRTASIAIIDHSAVPLPHPRGEYRTPVQREPRELSLAERIDLVRGQAARLKTDDRVVDWAASLWTLDTETLYLTSEGGRVHQRLLHLAPDLVVVASDGHDTQQRTLGGRGNCRQGGLELLDGSGFLDQAPVLAEEVLQLLAAPSCPVGTMDLLLAPDQMMLQIHESIGHPLELDRILGDERNYAGTSFVTLDMFGTYQYGSELLNVTFDPTLPAEFASYGFDDDGVAATREFIIRDGLLERPLGGALSQSRAGREGVANSRATSWNRPPIDRMANLNVEPGTTPVGELVASVERGVLMKTNTSWSIDDSRNKFQFGCEYGQLIEDGELTTVVKKPNYRGISATFWRNLKGVGDRASLDVHGTPYCGKGEPNQVIRVGHASPACLFGDVAVFGGV